MAAYLTPKKAAKSAKYDPYLAGKKREKKRKEKRVVGKDQYDGWGQR